MTQSRAPHFEVIQALVSDGLLSEDSPVIGLLDTDAILSQVAALKSAFPAHVTTLHTIAAKSVSLTPVLGLLASAGLGCEVASPGELALALRAGFAPENIIFDSPAKTITELRNALTLGIALNIDNDEEFGRVSVLVGATRTASRVGFRINPQVGAGGIDAMSTATPTSKFGFPLSDPGVRSAIIERYRSNSWLTQIHCHVGSQGCPMALMVSGIRETFGLAEEINHLLGRQQITRIDIGGGLPVNFDSDKTTPTFSRYVSELEAEIPLLFDGRYEVATEFGRALMAKSGMIVSQVEYVKEAGGRSIAITHAGAQVAARTVFMPDAWPLRVGVFHPDGTEKTGPLRAQDIAGPCCFAGDLIARNRELPKLEAGDIAAIYDTGAYYFSNHFSYNSLPRIAVYGYRAMGDGVRWSLIRAQQSIEEVVAESGLDSSSDLVAMHASGDNRMAPQ